MPKVIFKFNNEKDLRNIWRTCNFNSGWHDFKKNLNKDVLKIAQGKSFEECKDRLEEHYKKLHNSELIKIFVESLQKAWDKINDEFFKRLEKIMKRPICSKTFVAYITTMGRCPYNPDKKFFMVSLFYSFLNALTTCGHEIMHIQFHNTYWKNVEEKIGKEKTADLKEALTVLLNLEFKDLWFVKDRGYDSHQELREFIEKEWKEEKDFEILIKKCIEYLKK